MPIINLEPIVLDKIPYEMTGTNHPWLWNGYLMPGDVTLLTSLWKTGKTTLLTGLLQHLENGTPFLGRTVQQGRALIVGQPPVSGRC